MRQATPAQNRQSIYQVTLPNGKVVISSRALLHNKNAKEHDAGAILFLAYLGLLNVMPDRCISKTKLPAFPVWNNICVFLFGKPFYLVEENEFPAKQLARFSIAVSCPYLLFATDEVVHAALCGDEILAQRMIAANPRYLLARGNATDFSGREYNKLTPFQAALITGDVEMAEMMKPYFDRLPNGQAEMKQQVAEISSATAELKRTSKIGFAPMLTEEIYQKLPVKNKIG